MALGRAFVVFGIGKSVEGLRGEPLALGDCWREREHPPARRVQRHNGRCLASTGAIAHTVGRMCRGLSSRRGNKEFRMTRGQKICLFGLAGLLALGGAALVFIATFDWNRVRPLINEKVSAALGRPFAR